MYAWQDAWPRVASGLAAALTTGLAVAWRADSPAWLIEALAVAGAWCWWESGE